MESCLEKHIFWPGTEEVGGKKEAHSWVTQ